MPVRMATSVCRVAGRIYVHVPSLGESVVVVRGLCGVMGAMVLVVTHSVCKYYLK